MKKLIVIEGVDGSGKQTQSKMLFDALSSMMDGIELISFPNYESQSSALVKMYLNGEISENAKDINPYAASTFYAADRYITYKKEMENKMSEDGFFILDRYTTSNIVYQATKLPISKRDTFIKWLEDYEYNKLRLPKPDTTLFLDMPVWAAQKIKSGRANKINGSEKQDIHESNLDLMQNAYDNAIAVADACGFKKVRCVDGDRILSTQEIHDIILNIVL